MPEAAANAEAAHAPSLVRLASSSNCRASLHRPEVLEVPTEATLEQALAQTRGENVLPGAGARHRLRCAPATRVRGCQGARITGEVTFENG